MINHTTPFLLLACALSFFVIIAPREGQAATRPPTTTPAAMWDMAKLSAAPQTYPADDIKADGVKGLFFDGPMYQGKPTRVFAWIGLPKMEPGTKVPGMVLIHGGGGTAFADWVRLWNSRGYAAIAMDTCGNIPVRGEKGWKHQDDGGPRGVDFNPDRAPLTDQWTYQAVSDVILAHSLLRAQPEVDATRIGLTGASWGGYLTCIVASVDDRFRFAAPVYGCGFYLDTLFGDNLRKQTAEQRDRWMQWWDPSKYLRRASMPMLWVTGSNDFAYPLGALQQSYRLPAESRTLCVRLRMPHGHGGPAEKPEEIRVFADSILKDGTPLPRITRQGRDKNTVWADYSAQVRVVNAELNYTKDTGKWQDRKWLSIPARLVGDARIEATLPEGTTVYFLNLSDHRNCVVSTEHVEIK